MSDESEFLPHSTFQDSFPSHKVQTLSSLRQDYMRNKVKGGKAGDWVANDKTPDKVSLYKESFQPRSHTAGTTSEMEQWMKYRIKKPVKLDDDKSYNILTGKPVRHKQHASAQRS